MFSCGVGIVGKNTHQTNQLSRIYLHSNNLGPALHNILYLELLWLPNLSPCLFFHLSVRSMLFLIIFQKHRHKYAILFKNIHGLPELTGKILVFLLWSRRLSTTWHKPLFYYQPGSFSFLFSRPALSNTTASHSRNVLYLHRPKWEPLLTWSVTNTVKLLNFKFWLILIHLNQPSHIWLLATLLGNTTWGIEQSTFYFHMWGSTWFAWFPLS